MIVRGGAPIGPKHHTDGSWEEVARRSRAIRGITVLLSLWEAGVSCGAVSRSLRPRAQPRRLWPPDSTKRDLRPRPTSRRNQPPDALPLAPAH